LNLPEGQANKASEPFKKQSFFRNRTALHKK
jgi:hypothetical protein